MSGFLVQWNLGRLEVIITMIIHENNRVKEICIEIRSQHWGGNRQISMEDIIAVKYSPI